MSTLTSNDTDPLAASAELDSLLGPAFERSVVASVVFDAKGVIVAANPRAAQLFAVDRQSLLGRLGTEFTDLTTRLPRQQGNDFRRRDSGSNERDVELVTADGELRIAELVVETFDAPSGRLLVLAQFADVTQVRQDQKELTEIELRYRQLANNLPESSVVMYDKDLRILLALGEGLAQNGYHPGQFTGSRIDEALPTKAFAALESRYRGALTGQPADLLYLSPVTGRQFWARFRPLLDADGIIVGGLALSEDVTANLARDAKFEQMRHLSLLGSCTYSKTESWVFDNELLGLWGLDPSTVDVTAAFHQLLVPEDRLAIAAAQERLMMIGGKSSFTYRLRHGVTGEIRCLQATFESAVDEDGTLLAATATHLDVTDTVVAFEVAETIREQAEDDQRALVMRHITDVVSGSAPGPDGTLQGIADLAASELGAAAVIRLLTPDLDAVESDITSHPDEDTRLAIDAAMTRSTQCFEPGPIRDQVIRQGQIVSDVGSIRHPTNHDRFAAQTGWPIAHSITAPIRHRGQVLGLFSVIRDRLNEEYDAGDENLVQVLADFAGTAVGEQRMRVAVEQEAARRIEEMTVSQLELVEELAGMEVRERSQIADNIADDPIQLLVAATMHIDLLRDGTVDADQRELDRLAALLDSSLDRLRTLVHVDLAPPDLSFGIGDAIDRLGRSMFAPNRLRIVGHSVAPLSPPAATAAYRIVREALTNAKSHARASTITVTIEDVDSTVVFTITDDGIGANRIDGPGHLGLAAMRVRAEAEGGRLQVTSVPGAGTSVVLTLPIAAG